MPHINRDSYDRAHDDPSDAGELTYALYDTVCQYVLRSPSESIRYQRICEVRGALVGTMSEFDRLIAHPYEDTAILKNGDATPSELYDMLNEARAGAIMHSESRAPLRTSAGPKQQLPSADDLPVTPGPLPGPQ